MGVLQITLTLKEWDLLHQLIDEALVMNSMNDEDNTSLRLLRIKIEDSIVI